MTTQTTSRANYGIEAMADLQRRGAEAAANRRIGERINGDTLAATRGAVERLPRTVQNGETVDAWDAVGGVLPGTCWSTLGAYLLEVVEPVSVAEGRDQGGSGQTWVSGGIALMRHLAAGPQPHPAVLVALTDRDRPEENRWWNYGAPSGTHVRCAVTWVEVGALTPDGFRATV